MSRLIKLASWTGKPRANVIFVHGLMGHAYDTWRSDKRAEPAKDPSFWPLWLAQDIPGLTVYTLSYEAPASGWLGTAMPLQDRAVNVRETLLGEAEIRACPLTFICHSLGGLIVKQLLLDLKEQEARRPEAAALLEQIRQVAFLATPHTGSRKASLLQHLRFLAWPTPVARSLIANDPALRKINVSYRGLAGDRHVCLEHKVFYETLNTSAGQIVDEASADPGLHCMPIPIHADHIRIAKPQSRDSDVYKQTRDFLSRHQKQRAKSSHSLHALPDISNDQPWNIFPRLARVAAITIMSTIAYQDIRTFIANGEDGDNRQVIMDLAHRIKPGAHLDYPQAIVEVSLAIDIAIEARSPRSQVIEQYVPPNNVSYGKISIEDYRRLEDQFSEEMSRGNAQSVARTIAQIAALKHPDNRKNRLFELKAEQKVWYEDGRDKGFSFELTVAIEIARLMRANAEGTEEIGRALTVLGTALQTLGERESGTERLEEAVAVYRDALRERLRERAPLEWAATQNNLAAALWTIGERKNDTVRLKEAVVAYRAVLEELPRERTPLDWAATLNNLGAALQVLGKRESSTAMVEQAVAAYRTVLEVRTRERVPLDWAMTQNNLGAALQTMGERESGTERLEEAVEAYGLALAERNRERVPLQWAVSTGNQGVAMRLIAERRRDLTLAEAALGQIRAALDTCRAGGHAANAAIFESELPKAQALVATLKAK